MFETEFMYFLQIRTNYIERYIESFEKLAYHIIQGLDTQAIMIKDGEYSRKKSSLYSISTPLMINEVRKPCQFLLKTMKVSQELRDLITRMLDNLAIYFLWKKSDNKAFEN